MMGAKQSPCLRSLSQAHGILVRGQVQRSVGKDKYQNYNVFGILEEDTVVEKDFWGWEGEGTLISQHKLQIKLTNSASDKVLTQASTESKFLTNG